MDLGAVRSAFKVASMVIALLLTCAVLSVAWLVLLTRARRCPLPLEDLARARLEVRQHQWRLRQQSRLARDQIDVECDAVVSELRRQVHPAGTVGGEA